jgi:hypothetical protein
MTEKFLSSKGSRVNSLSEGVSEVELTQVKIKIEPGKEHLLVAVMLKNMLKERLNIYGEIIYTEPDHSEPTLYLLERPSEVLHPEHYLSVLSTDFILDPNGPSVLSDSTLNHLFKTGLKSFDSKAKQHGLFPTEHYAINEYLLLPLVFKKSMAVFSGRLQGIGLHSDGTLNLSKAQIVQ